MKVLVTGATGFIGSHATAALATAGHDVRVIVRDPDKATRVLGALEVDTGSVEVRRGDVLDRDSVTGAVEGCGAVLHAAGVVGVSRTTVGDSRAANVAGTELVIGSAVEAGCDPILFTSSVATLVPTTDPVLTVDSPLATPVGSYARSKVEAERYVRALQRDGAPVTSFLIGGVFGPYQPEVGSGMDSIVAAARQAMPVTSSGIGVIDVRDLAALITAAVEPGRGPRRFLVGGTYLTWREYVDELSVVLGRKAHSFPMPAPLLRGLGRVVDRANRVGRVDYPITYEAALHMTALPPSDDRSTVEELGVSYRPVRETLRDSVRWLVEAGHLEPRHAPGVLV